MYVYFLNLSLYIDVRITMIATTVPFEYKPALHKL